MSFERRSWLLIDGIILALFLLSTRLVYWQAVRGMDMLPAVLAPESAGLNKAIHESVSLDNVQNLPQPVIQRLNDLLKTITRGSIYDRNNRLLASDRLDSQGNRYRFYSEPTLAPLIGYVSGLGVGIAGLERRYDEDLLGFNRLDVNLDRMIHKPITGSDLVLTIDSALQRRVEQALEGNAGSITVMDAHSGAILAMAGLPRFDPNRILEPGYLQALEESCGGAPQCSGALLNRPAQALYPPGSTWKTVTLIAALDTGQVSPDTVFDFGEPEQGPDGPYYVYKVDGGVIIDPNHSESRLNLELSYAKSANAAFAQIGDEMPPDTLIDYASRFGFGAPGNVHRVGTQFPLEFDFNPSQLAQDENSLYQNNWLRAATAIGQGELLTSPLNMGMVVLAVLNNGNLPVPYIVQGIRDSSGKGAIIEPEKVVVHNLMKAETAQIVRQMMIGVVTQGSGRKAAIEGLTIGGKTGTAQLGGDLPPHAWFIGFAEEGDRAVVIVVMIENGGEGSQIAAPIFAAIADAALHHVGEPVAETLPQAIEPTPLPTEQQLQVTPVATEGISGATTTPTPASTFLGLPPPDIQYKPGKVDFTEAGSTSCPGNQKGPLGSGYFIWPSVYQALSGEPFEEGHPGIDLSAPSGTAVYAADAGLVIFAGWTGIGYGNTVVIDHGNGYKTLYAHLSQVSQYCGAKVKAGQLIGLSGSTGNSSGPHLHFEVRVPGGYLDPLKALPTP